MEFKIGSLPVLVADQGDVVSVPAQTWHRVRSRHRNGDAAGRGGIANSHVYGLTGGAE